MQQKYLIATYTSAVQLFCSSTHTDSLDLKALRKGFLLPYRRVTKGPLVSVGDFSRR